MSENEPTVADPSAPADATASQGTPQDDGFERISRDELAGLRRTAGRLPEMQRFYESARKAGFNDPSGFESHASQMAALKERGLSMDQVIGLLGQDVGDQTAEQPQSVDIDQIKSDLMSELRKENASSQHRQAVENHLKGLDSLDYLELGDDASDEDKATWSLLARAMYGKHQGLYPEDHPLHDSELAPLADDKIAELVHGPLKEFKSRWAGGQLAKIAKAATGTKTSGAAARGGTQDGSTDQEPPPDNLKDAIARRIK